jgi:Cof subfamily protein (haloacid dehalogenase superfamily)
MKSFRLAAIDLDDTLLGPDKQVSAANRAAIQKLRGNGVQIVLASGRKHGNMTTFHAALGCTGYIISGQGALVKHAETGEIVYQAYIPAALAQQTIADGLSRQMTAICYHDHAIYAQGDATYIDLYTRLSGDRIEARDLRTLATESFQKILWLASADRIEALQSQVALEYAHRLDTVNTEPEFLEFTLPGVNKSSALAALAAHLGIPQQQTLAFGDGNNDVAMLRWAGLGVAMDHAKAAAKSAADLIAPPGDPETSFARAIDAIFALPAAVETAAA